MIQQEFSEFLGIGSVSRQGSIVPSHATVRAVLTANVGDLHDATDKNLAAKVLITLCSRPFMESRLVMPRQEHVRHGRNVLGSHRLHSEG
jgi:hypothetical protein